MIGQTLSHYEILEQIGAGGMGVVYRARDTSLGRDVALKVLPPEFGHDQERVSRFKREAKALAALDHPNIVTIFAVEEAHGQRFLTMQLVQGRTLDRLIPSDGMAVDKALRFGSAIAEALGAAHERGLVHRDLKPGNVMVSDDEQVKVLDFGLAKLRSSNAGGTEATQLSTEQMTMEGVILGTAAYMSPEQAEGKATDHRSDIFSLGVLLYEMVTGTRPFYGETAMSLISSIIKDAPAPVTDHKPSLPPGLERVISRALAKDPRHRYQSALDLRHDLADLLGPGDTTLSSPPRRRPRKLPAAGLVVLALATVAAAAGLVWLSWRSGKFSSESSTPTASFSQLTALPSVEQFPSLSPDGEWIVYSGVGPAEDLDIFLQSTVGRTPINLTKNSPDDDGQPTFSPDGQRIAFWSSRQEGGVFVMGRTGEAVRRVTREGFNPSWSPDGTKLVYATEKVGLMPLNWDGLSELWVVPVEGGEPSRILAGDGVQPRWSPHGHRIVYQTRLSTELQMDIITIPADGGEPVPATADAATDWSPTWSPDGRYIYFVSDRAGSMNLWRVEVNERSGRPRGEPEAITTPAAFVAHPSISTDGRYLAFTSVHMRQNLQMAAFDPQAHVFTEPTWLTSGSRQWSSPDPSPYGDWVAFYSRDLPEGDIYVVRSDGAELRQVTGDEALDRVPRWTPDGERISYFSTRRGKLQLWWVRADGSENRQLTQGQGSSLGAWSPDGAQVAVNGLWEGGVAGAPSLVDPDNPEQRVELPTPDDPLAPFTVNSWSPDGRRLAGMTAYGDKGIIAYSLEAETYELLTDFGQWPVWLPDSRHLLFVSRGKAFYVVDRETREVKEIFSVRRDVLGPPRLTRDGRRMVYSRRNTEADIWLLSFE